MYDSGIFKYLLIASFIFGGVFYFTSLYGPSAKKLQTIYPKENITLQNASR